MILFELTGSENNPVYQELEISNAIRHYDFLRSIVTASLQAGKPFLSQHVIKAINFHAITCLHINPGEYRPCEVEAGDHVPPAFYRVPALMDDFVNTVNRHWEQSDPVVLATFVLWRLNNIHPFINGNGRTARACAYFVLCVKSGGWLPGSPIVPELIRREHAEYVEGLREAHASARAGTLNYDRLHALLVRLTNEQLASAPPATPDDQAPPASEPTPTVNSSQPV